MRNEFLVFGQPLIEEEEKEEVLDSMAKAWLGTGPKVARFERDFAAYKGATYAAALNSCTAALARVSCRWWPGISSCAVVRRVNARLLPRMTMSLSSCFMV